MGNPGLKAGMFKLIRRRKKRERKRAKREMKKSYLGGNVILVL
jgi:hypothetical protein